MHAHHTRARLACVGLLALALSSCTLPLGDLIGVIDTGVQRTDLILDEGIASLNNASANWQQVLKDTMAKLTSDAQSTIRNEISDLLNRGIAAVGSEFRCNADFMVNRMRQGLTRIKAKYLKQPPPLLEPQLCDVVPLAVDRAVVEQGRLNRLELYGYDFDTTPVSVLLQNTNGTLDVSHVLNRPTHYHMTLTLGGSTGVQLTKESQRLVLKWSNREISTVAIIQPTTPPCQTKIITHQPTAISFIPRHTVGDRDYDGSGPDVTARVTLALGGGGAYVNATTYMKARETESDWTTAEGSRTDQIYVPDPGWRVSGILVGTQSGCPALSSCFHYVDTDHEADIYPVGNGPISRFEFVGDTSGDEAGTRTSVKATFNPLRFELTQQNDCISQSTAKELERMDLIAPETLKRMESAPAPEGN